MDIEIVVDDLIQHLRNWFNSSDKTTINDRYKADSITVQQDWIIINVDCINITYSSYFKRDSFYKNAELLSKKLVEVAKEWMKANEVQVYHLKFKIIKQGAEFPRQGLIRV